MTRPQSPLSPPEVTVAELVDDPYPVYRRPRDAGPCVWLSPANRYVVTRWDDVFALDENPALTAAEPASLMTRAMGLSMLRTDGETHQRQRVPAHRGLRAIEFRSRWAGKLDQVADELLDGLEGDGGGELMSEFAGPYAAATLKRLLGVDDVTNADMQTWSQALIDGIGNYADDAQVWRRCEAADAGIDAAIERWWSRAKEGAVLHSLGFRQGRGSRRQEGGDDDVRTAAVHR